MYTIRVHWSQVQGRTVLNYEWPDISQHSVIHISVSEAGEYHPEFTSGWYERQISNTDIRVNNICPREGGVTFIVEVLSRDPVNIITDIMVFSPPLTVVRN